jgi:hypothetical protein
MTQDDESSLLLVEAGEVKIKIVPPPPAKTPPTDSPSGDPLTWAVADELLRGHHGQGLCRAEKVMHLVEEKVFVKLSDAEQKDYRRWVLDTGATNHMTWSRSAFANLNRSVQGTVKFGDGSITQIEGVGTILFSCKNGEHWEFVGVYCILKLNSNIVSVGQLDEGGLQTIIDGGVMKIRDAEHRLLVKVIRSPNHLYVLSVEIARPMCLVV